jgi:hypothetical protein
MTNYDKQDQILAWNDTAPTSSVFSVGSGGSSNGSGASMISLLLRRETRLLRSLEATQVMVMQMEHLFIQGLNLRLF